ncbi:MAG TPA: hypothetical protein DD706_23895 [Nitrospiraceae bacterium]|nr:hypothetical protein [Nitrospiraceae bacterium]
MTPVIPDIRFQKSILFSFRMNPCHEPAGMTEKIKFLLRPKERNGMARNGGGNRAKILRIQTYDE